MKSLTFFSSRTKRYVTVTLGFNKITYVTENPHTQETSVISFDRWSGCHIDDIHLKVDCVEVYNDPRFEYWLKSGEFENVKKMNL